VLGQYIPGEGFFYKLNPVNKIIFVFLIMVLAVSENSFQGLSFFFSTLIFLFVLNKIPLSTILRGIKSILFFIIIASLMHVFFSKEGKVLVSFGKVIITEVGVKNALIIIFRLLTVILANVLLTSTTDPTDIAFAMEKILTPLKIFRFPVNDFAVMLSLSIRFIPVLFSEMNKIIESQVSRGSDFDSPSFIKKIKSMPAIIIPLFIGSFYRAEEIAMAMEARCFGCLDRRTSLNKREFSYKDLTFFLLYFSLVVYFVIAKFKLL
jgi:energy-coupling factor transport system permease protein